MDQILGQDQAVAILRAALQSGRLHHAYVFHGPAGVGKFTTALAFARILLCHDAGGGSGLFGQAPDITACGTCRSCKLIGSRDAGAHPDLHIVTKELARYSDDKTIRDRKLTSIPVEVLRANLVDPVYRAAGFHHNKVFIVDEAELLNPAGQNLLLKTLEEPPAGTYLILVTASQDRLLATVRSRCQRVAFPPLPDQVVCDWLDSRQPELSEAKRAWLVQFAGGSLGRVELALEYELLAWSQEVVPAVEAMANGRYPVELGAQIAGHIDAFAKQWVDRHENASKDAANRSGAALMWAMISRLADKHIHQIAAKCDAADPSGSEAMLQGWLGVIDALQVVEGELASNVNLALAGDHLVSLMFRALTDQYAAA